MQSFWISTASSSLIVTRNYIYHILLNGLPFSVLAHKSIMQAEKQKSWKICIHAKAKNFHFKIKVTNIIPTWELHHCSILLKLGKFLLRLKSEYGKPIIPSQPQRKTLKSKFFGFFKKFHFRRTKNRAIDLHPEAGNHLGWFAYKV
jgi:hypothetical protein